MSAISVFPLSNVRSRNGGLTPEEFTRWADKLSLTSSARKFVEAVRESPPSRLVGQFAHWSRSGDYQSEKMMHSVQSESESAEWAYILILEYSKKCVEYHGQILSVTVKNTYENGRCVSRPYTADFLVMLDDDVYAVECKTHSQLQDLLIERPTDWKRTDDGYVYQPAKDAFEKLGLKHIVFSSGECTKVQFGNLGLLIHARHSANTVTDELANKMISAFSHTACLRLSELLTECGHEDITPFVQLIERGVLYARIEKDSLMQPNTAWVATDPRVFEHVTFDDVSHESASIDSIPLSILPNQKCFAHALHTLERLAIKATPQRSRVRWRGKVRHGAAKGLSPVLSLAPAWSKCGNRVVRLNRVVLEYFESYFKEHYCTATAKRIMAAYREYEELAKEAHPLFKPMGRDAFSDRVRARKQASAAGHGGIRAEMAAAPPSEIEDQAPRPTRNLELAHIDHHETDVYVRIISKRGKHYVARCWLTVMVDARTGMILAIWLSLKSPSRRSCAMVIRRCVKAFGKLPENLITDRGADFESNYYLELLAYTRVHKKRRPVSNARYGSEAERLFKILIEVFTSRLSGRLRTILERRSVSKSHSAEENATLSPEELFEILEKFREWYNTEYVAPHEDRPPQEIHDSLTRLCSCSGKPVTYDHAFEIATAVETKSFTVDPSKGFSTDIGWYWHPKLGNLTARKKKRIEVREEPDDPYRAYALVDGEWITCRNTKDAAFVNKAPHEKAGEAMRLLDGASERRQAKRDADAKLTRIIVDSDRARETKKLPPVSNESNAPLPPNPFDRMRKHTVTKLPITKWRKAV